MGNGYMIKCKKCEYSFMANLGIGMMFPTVYENAVAAIKKGEFGEEYKKFFEEHENAAVNCDLEAAVCTKCGKLDSVYNLDLYLPKNEKNVEQVNCLMPDELKTDYVKCMEYDHICPDCGGSMRVFDLSEELSEGKVKCPECGETLEVDPDSLMTLWD